MMRTGDELISPRAAAGRALALLQRVAPAAAVAVWGRSGRGWQMLGGCGTYLTLPAPETPAAYPAVARPLEWGGETVGWLSWRGIPDDAMPPVATMLAGELAAIQLCDDRAKSRAAQDTLLEIGQLADAEPGLEPFLEQVHRLLSGLFDVDNLAIALYDPPSGSLRFPLWHDRRLPVPVPDRLPDADGSGQTGLIGEVLTTGETLVLGGAALAERLGDITARCWLGIPLSVTGPEAGGVLVTRRDAGQAPLSAVEQRLLHFAARHIGSALNRLQYHARLERQVWLRTQELEGANARLVSEAAERQRAEQLQQVLFRIAELANTSLSLSAFLGGLHRQLASLMPATNCLVALYDAAGDTIRYPHWVDEYRPAPAPHKPGNGHVEQVLHSGRSLLIDRPAPGGDQPAVHSWLGVPLFVGHELIGVLAVQSYRNDVRYRYRERELLEYVANNIGAALARVRALEELQRAYAELEQRVRDRTSELDAVNARLQFDSTHDPLTRLPNRSYFARMLRRTWDAYQSGAGERFAVLFIDLDRFKLVNDTLGHLAGDHLLAEAGSRIRSCMRHYDFLARLGGDEFAVLLFGVEQMDGCEPIARRMVDEFDRPIVLGGREVFTTASIGVVLADRTHHHLADDLLRDADHAMYRTKQQGRHGYTLFNHELRADQADQLALEAELRRALEERDQLVPYYQPFIDARSGQLTGFETLVRWHHPQRGLLLPAAFMPVAEESGLVVRLDRYMIEAACAQLSLWRTQQRVGAHISLHINLSSANFHDAGLVAWITGIIDQYRLPPSMLHLEITESALIDVPDTASSVMRALQSLGVRLALDDFGTGYSALSYLQRYRFDVLKIDQSFVADLERKEESAAIVRAILALADALSLDVVAEGVETIEQVERLKALGCAKLQGFYFSRPVPAAEVDWARLASFRLPGAGNGEGL